MERKMFGPKEKVNPDYYFATSIIFIDTCKRADFVCATEDEAEIFADEMQEEINKEKLMSCAFVVEDTEAKSGNPRKIFFVFCWSEPRIILGDDAKPKWFDINSLPKDPIEIIRTKINREE